MTTALAMLRAAPVSRAREGRDEQHMNAIPKNKKERQFDKNAKYQRPAPICPQFSGSVNRSWPFARGDLPDIVVPLPQVAKGDPSLARFLSRARSLLTRKFRVAISGTIGSRPLGCAFRD